MRNFIRAIDATTGYTMLIRADQICTVEGVGYYGETATKVTFIDGRPDEYVKDTIDMLSSQLCD